MPPIRAIIKLTLLSLVVLVSPAGASEGKPASHLDLNRDQEALFRGYVERVGPPAIADPITVGAILPIRVELHPLPAAISVEVPAARTRRFVRSQAGIAIVDPADRKVLQILPPRP